MTPRCGKCGHLHVPVEQCRFQQPAPKCSSVSCSAKATVRDRFGRLWCVPCYELYAEADGS